MKSLVFRLSLLTAVLFFVGLVAPSLARAQEERSRPAPESPPSPKSEPPAPAPEPVRSDPPPAPAPAPEPVRSEPPAPAPEPVRSEPPASAPTSGGGSSNNEDSQSPHGGIRESNSRGGNNRVGNNEGGGRVRGNNGSRNENRPDRVIGPEPVTADIEPARTRGGNPGSNTGGNVGGGNPGGNRGGGAATGGNTGGRYGDRDRGRGRWRDRHRGGRGHRHYRGDECYQVPAYDDTVSYVASSYPGYQPQDSLSAYDRGYSDGLYTGANDGRRGQTYDPERSRFYKSGTAGYRSGKGDRDVYKQAYRDGFLRGYREGFENWQKYFVGGEFRR